MAFGRRKRPSTIRGLAGKRGRDEGLFGGNWRSLKEALREEYSAARKARPDRTGQRLLLDVAPASELEWSDFDHVACGRDHIERVIRGALAPNFPTAHTALECTGSTVGWEMSDNLCNGFGSIEPDGCRPEFKGTQRHA